MYDLVKIRDDIDSICDLLKLLSDYVDISKTNKDFCHHDFAYVLKVFVVNKLEEIEKKLGEIDE